MKKVISGIQPSGKPTLGNYLGAFKPQVSMQDDADVTYFIADLHAITARQVPADLRHNTYSVAAWYLACGLDPQKATMFVQSHVSAHAQMGWILNTFSQMGELERMTQFKDKSNRATKVALEKAGSTYEKLSVMAGHNKPNINVGLFAYPVLQAADILLHQIDEVPVGDDQKQHLELTRNIATRFNNHYCGNNPDAKPIFTVPEIVLPKAGARVKDLQDPTSKMSKSIGGKGTILMEDDLKTIAKKVKSSMTDSDTNIAYDKENKAGISNLLEIYSAIQGVSIEAAVSEFEGQQYGAFKAAVADALVADIEPVQNRYKELMQDKGELDRILKMGAEKASIEAFRTLNKVMKKVGFTLPIE
ncbi:MAG: tryptophanyl-tRNA synthetase [Alphaproteobacteria bacterium]|jgi:tryptophanyl-tRNA synthetase